MIHALNLLYSIQVKFTKRIYYPNISGRGSIDVDFIRDQWSLPSLRIIIIYYDL
ncbi:hypothetical protein RhiirC2_664425 [Rhizophagus irregularis]|uniref:Uncharacterized protein n=1 Tax=Rhizophagus irregularis TaxID=588596 RepID=A0A2N1MX54_9GLOM|nr:hypothetical protein RhiirC2_664425 [Rhizophagus irregularis]